MEEDEQVPPSARLVRDFVNAYEKQTDSESFTSPSALRAWLVHRGLLSGEASLSSADTEAAITVREGLRAILLEHAGYETDREAVQRLNETLTGFPVRLMLTAGVDAYRFDSAIDTSFGSSMVQLIDAIRACSQDGTWPRLKVCSRGSCRWAFYDGSRNRVRRWCSMSTCGNHIKMQKAYARKKANRSSLSGV